MVLASCLIHSRLLNRDAHVCVVTVHHHHNPILSYGPSILINLSILQLCYETMNLVFMRKVDLNLSEENIFTILTTWSNPHPFRTCGLNSHYCVYIIIIMCLWLWVNVWLGMHALYVWSEGEKRSNRAKSQDLVPTETILMVQGNFVRSSKRSVIVARNWGSRLTSYKTKRWGQKRLSLWNILIICWNHGHKQINGVFFKLQNSHAQQCHDPCREEGITLTSAAGLSSNNNEEALALMLCALWIIIISLIIASLLA